MSAASGNNRPVVLSVRDLHAWYGESHILHGMNFDVRQGEVVTLLGRNGAGRTTTLKAILGLTGRRTGSVTVGGVETVGMSPHRIARLGLGYCPEERGIFASLSAEENLLLLPEVGPDGMGLEEIYAMFPNLKERADSPGTKLSGGEQQMLAVARALLGRPKLLLLDEPSLGLAPLIVLKIFDVIRKLNAEEGMSVLIVEQNARLALKLAHRGYVMETGVITMSDKASSLLNDQRVKDAYLGE